jgi:hypothetical protein
MLVLKRTLDPQEFVFPLLEKILLDIKERIHHFSVIGKHSKMLPPNSIILLHAGLSMFVD